MSSRDNNPLVYVAKLSSHVREKDLEHDFGKFGSIKTISLKNGYAFIVSLSYLLFLIFRNMRTIEMPKTPSLVWMEKVLKGID